MITLLLILRSQLYGIILESLGINSKSLGIKSGSLGINTESLGIKSGCLYFIRMILRAILLKIARNLAGISKCTILMSNIEYKKSLENFSGLFYIFALNFRATIQMTSHAPPAANPAITSLG